MNCPFDVSDHADFDTIMSEWGDFGLAGRLDKSKSGIEHLGCSPFTSHGDLQIPEGCA
jgi:hypothetical protein